MWNRIYVGETGRTIGSRVKEHLTMEKAPNHGDGT
jgi:hypothetical protein